ncbi:MAG: 50S ribosomal protein L5 [Candidatus Omnitrophica bacterium]|nr:50S ribosomal protein L5 [Candidatus Omnitrophota bacterium]
MPEGNLKEKYVPRLKQIYRDTIVGQMKEKFGYANPMQIPRLKKIVINMGIGQATSDAKLVEKAAADLTKIAGQKVKITRAKKPISNFKLRKGLAIGCCVTLRGLRMYDFLDRLIVSAIPRIRDFRGFSSHGFDHQGNYNFGITEQSIFPEIDIDRIERTQGMNITICTTAETDEEACELLRYFGFPFKK